MGCVCDLSLMREWEGFVGIGKNKSKVEGHLRLGLLVLEEGLEQHEDMD